MLPETAIEIQLDPGEEIVNAVASRGEMGNAVASGEENIEQREKDKDESLTRQREKEGKETKETGKERDGPRRERETAKDKMI